MTIKFIKKGEKQNEENPKYPPRTEKLKLFKLLKKSVACVLATSLMVCMLTACGQNSDSSAESSTEPTEISTVSELSTESQASTNTQNDNESASTDISEDIQNSIYAICPEAYLLESDGSLTVDLTDGYDNTDSSFLRNCMYDCIHILGASDFDENYSGIGFSYLTDDLTFILTISSYSNMSDYASNLICTGNDSNYVAAAQILYQSLFYNHDLENRQAIATGKTADEYDIDGGDSVLEEKSEDDLWFYASFDKDIPHELSDTTYVLNYRYDTDDKSSYGQTVKNDIDVAADILTDYIQNNRNVLSFDKILIICFDGDSDTRLMEYQLEESDSGSWSVSLCNFYDDDFKSGYASASE